jgi:HEAT repeat protein
LGKKIFLALVIVAVLYGIIAGIVGHIEMNRLAHDLRYGSDTAKVSAATELMKRDRLYDTTQAMKPEERIKVMSVLPKVLGERTVKQSLILLKDTDAKVRAEVVKGLIVVARDHVDLLIPALKDSDENVRNGTKDTLVGIGPKVIPLVQPAAKIAETRDAAIDVLVRLGEPSVPPVVALLSEDDQDTRMAAASALGKIKSIKATPALLKATGDIAAVRTLAISSLCDICDPRSSDLLISVLAKNTDNGEVRARTARALSVIGGPNAIAALTNALGDFDLKVRSSTIGGLQRMGAPAVGAITAKLASPSKVFREAAAQSLERTDSPDASAILVKMARDADPVVRTAAAKGLGVQTAAPHPEVLAALLGDGADEVGGAAVASLSDMGGRAIPGLITVVRSAPADVARFRASEALARIGSDSVPPLMSLIGTDAVTSRWAAYALGRTGDQRAKPALQKLAKAPDTDLAAIAQRALARM